MVISVRTISRSADTTDQGQAVFAAVLKAADGGSAVVVSFDGIRNVTSSFANAAFAQLLDRFSLADVKGWLRVVDSNRQINDMIKHCLDCYAARLVAA
jgi:hypothetical protein